MILEEFKKDYNVYNSAYNYVFNSYYETVGKRVLRTNRGNLTRPSVEEIYKYRTYVNEQLLDFLDQQEYVKASIAELIELGLQHEQQHQELLLYDIKYILGTNPLFPAYLPLDTLSPKASSAPLGYLEVQADNYQIGHKGPEFSYDNEHGVHQVYLHDYAIADRLVTNGEYLEFIEAGGYQKFQYWYSEAWEWVKTEKKQAPFHWHNIEGNWHLYSLNGLHPIHLDEPVSHISQFEASAFALWKDMRLPTEFEWEVACKIHQPNHHADSNFVDKKNFNPMPANNGNQQFYGDLWEWTNSSYLPYPYYKAAPGAVGEYNGKFMINQMVLRGGSYATPENHIRNTYRNFFHPHLNWHFTGIRLSKYV